MTDACESKTPSAPSTPASSQLPPAVPTPPRTPGAPEDVPVRQPMPSPPETPAPPRPSSRSPRQGNEPSQGAPAGPEVSRAMAAVHEEIRGDAKSKLKRVDRDELSGGRRGSMLMSIDDTALMQLSDDDAPEDDEEYSDYSDSEASSVPSSECDSPRGMPAASGGDGNSEQTAGSGTPRSAPRRPLRPPKVARHSIMVVGTAFPHILSAMGEEFDHDDAAPAHVPPNKALPPLPSLPAALQQQQQQQSQQQQPQQYRGGPGWALGSGGVLAGIQPWSLVVWATSPDINSCPISESPVGLLRKFLMAYRAVGLTSASVLELIKRRYAEAPDSCSAVLDVVTQWLQLSFEWSDASLVGSLVGLIHPAARVAPEAAREVLATIQRVSVASRATQQEEPQAADPAAAAAAVTRNRRLSMISRQVKSIGDVSARELATQITRTESVMFQRIKLKEMFYLEDPALSPNLARFVTFHKQMSNWVVSTILQEKDPQSRRKMIKLFLMIALELRKLRNYNSMGAVVFSLSNAAISPDRLKRSWRPELAQILENLLEPTRSNFKALRLAMLKRDAPSIPLIAVPLRDIQLTCECSPSYLPGASEHLINWNKIQVVSAALELVADQQKQPYKLPAYPEVAAFIQTNIISARFMTEKEAYDTSLSVEPRRSSRPASASDPQARRTARARARATEVFGSLRGLGSKPDTPEPSPVLTALAPALCDRATERLKGATKLDPASVVPFDGDNEVVRFNARGDVVAIALPTLVSLIVAHEAQATPLVLSSASFAPEGCGLTALDALLLGHTSLCSSSALLATLSELVSKAMPEAERVLVHEGTAKFLSLWAETSPSDLNDVSTTAAAKALLDTLAKSTSGFAVNLVRVVRDTLERATRRAPVPSVQVQPPTDSSQGAIGCVLEVPAEELARQLALWEHASFVSARLSRLLFVRGEPESLAASELISGASQLSLWAASAVLEQKERSHRKDVIKHLIKVASECRRIHNYASMMSLVYGLQHPAVCATRLRQSWSSDMVDAFAELEDACTRGLDATCRQALSCGAPCVVHVDMVTCLLAVQSESFTEFLPSSHDLVNWCRVEAVAKALGTLIKYQTTPFAFAPTPRVQEWLARTVPATRLPGAQAYATSIVLEPL
eukprot:m51a1_g2761 hypothetical protein (1136) ;mRNA; r:977560-981290